MRAPSRRAMVGILAAGAMALATGGADALSWGRQSCHGFRNSLHDQDAIVRAHVLRDWDQRDGGVNCSSWFEARVTQTITGPVRPGRKLTYLAVLYTCDTDQQHAQGYAPQKGDDVVLFLTRRPETGAGWAVTGEMSSARYNGWAARGCTV